MPVRQEDSLMEAYDQIEKKENDKPVKDECNRFEVQTERNSSSCSL
jgi:hypothetical protein